MTLIFTSGESDLEKICQFDADATIVLFGGAPGVKLTDDERRKLSDEVLPILAQKGHTSESLSMLYDVPDPRELNGRTPLEQSQFQLVSIRRAFLDRVAARGQLLVDRIKEKKNTFYLIKGPNDYRVWKEVPPNLHLVDCEKLTVDGIDVQSIGGEPTKNVAGEVVGLSRYLPYWPASEFDDREDKDTILREPILLSYTPLLGKYDVQRNPDLSTRKIVDESTQARIILDAARSSLDRAYQVGGSLVLHCGNKNTMWVWKNAGRDSSEVSFYAGNTQGYGEEVRVSLTRKSDGLFSFKIKSQEDVAKSPPADYAAHIKSVDEAFAAKEYASASERLARGEKKYGPTIAILARKGCVLSVERKYDDAVRCFQQAKDLLASTPLPEETEEYWKNNLAESLSKVTKKNS